jgi:hypothetical protein
MPIQYTCRVLVVRTESGKLRVRYGHLSEEHVRFLTIHGPRMFLPPDGEMTDEEFARWEFETVHNTGFTYSYSPAPLDAPLVEAKRTYEDTIPKGVVRTKLFWGEFLGRRERTLGVRVTNGWNQHIPRFSLSADCHYDAPQPVQMGKTQVMMLIDSELMLPITDLVGISDLRPTITVEWFLDPRALPVLRRGVDSLSTESYYIALRTYGYEFDRIPGEVVREFLDSYEQENEG